MWSKKSRTLRVMLSFGPSNLTHVPTPILKVPWPVFKCNHRSVLEHEEFVATAIKELVQMGCVVSSLECPTVCSPLSVVANAKGIRFAKLLRQSVVKRWRGKGIRAIVYIDDGIVASKSQEQCLMDNQLVSSDLDLAGFVLNVSKS